MMLKYYLCKFVNVYYCLLRYLLRPQGHRGVGTTGAGRG